MASMNVAGQGKAPLSSFPLRSVRLLESPFLRAQQTDMKYMLSLDPDRLLAPFLREAGLPSKASSYANWENTGLDGHIGGHYLSALSNMYEATGDAAIGKRLDYMLAELRRYQLASGNGYIGGIPQSAKLWQEIKTGNIRAESFSLNGRWVPLYNIHKLFAGLIDAWQLSHRKIARQMLLALSEWFYTETAALTDAQLQDMLRSEHGGINEVFADVYAISGDKKFLQLSERLAHRQLLDPLLQRRDMLDGMHANTQIPKVLGFVRTAELGLHPEWMDAGRFFWERVAMHRSVAIGGNSVREHFNPSGDFSSMISSREGPETCNSYNMLKLSRHLFQDEGGLRYMDFYEQVLYNHILSSQHPDGGFVYFTPIRPAHYRVYSEAQESFWCCVGSGLENHGKYGEMIYAKRGNDLLVNLFIPSELQWKEQGLSLTQSGDYPFGNKMLFSLQLKNPKHFAIRLRRPAWLKEDAMILRLNGQIVNPEIDSNGYVAITRRWDRGERLEVEIKPSLRAVSLPDHSRWIAFMYGPLVLAAVTDSLPHQETLGGAGRMGHIAGGPLLALAESPMLVQRQDMAAGLTMLDSAKLHFSAAAMTAQDKYRNLVLQPFFQIHDARYLMYWPYVQRDSLESFLTLVRTRERETQRIEDLTIDKVYPGEQQPESDHGFRSELSESGIFREEHFRRSRNWFSYVMRNAEGGAGRLRVRLHGSDAGNTTSVNVNGRDLPPLVMNAKSSDFIEFDVALPPDLKKSAVLTVTFSAVAPKTTARIFMVRLMK